MTDSATCNKCNGPLGVITTGAGTYGKWYQCQDCGVDQGDPLAILNARYAEYGIAAVVAQGVDGDPYLNVVRTWIDPPFHFYDTAKTIEDAEAMMAYYVAEQGRL